MRKYLMFAVCCLLSVPTVRAAPSAMPNWHMKPTVCKPSNSLCYPAMNAGFDPEEWDVGGNCKGKKIICENAIVGGHNPFSKAEISDPATISADFDATVFVSAGTCFGQRRTRNNGVQAKVGDAWRDVWCSGILESPDETLPNGQIALAAEDQPTCKSLKENGRIGVLAGQCYGKSGYPEGQFYIECAGGDLLPRKIAVLNGAGNYRVSDQANPAPSGYPTNAETADALFGKMAANAAERRAANQENN
jgi:hypothetical protein